MGGLMENWKKTERLFEEELARCLFLLKKNHEAIPEEELNTRYRKSYRRLKADIAGLTQEYLKIHAAYGIFFEERDRKAVMDAVNGAIKESGVMAKAREAVFSRQDMEEVRELAEGLHRLVWDRTERWRTGACAPQEEGGQDGREKPAAEAA